MATYAIGDIQGCFSTLQALLERLRFDPGADTLWLVGDLVNRGPSSLEVLRWALAHDEQLVCVLGNHDLHLLSTAAGYRQPSPRDTLGPILAADDRDELLGWLRRRPLAHGQTVAGKRLLLVHAGLPPGWGAEQCLQLASEACEALRTTDGSELLRSLAGVTPSRWAEDLSGDERLAMIVALLTRLRCCRHDGRPCLRFNGPPADAPPGCHPWHTLPTVAWADRRIVCGHWAAQGLALSERVIALDSGCVWGGPLTACRLEDGELFSEPCRDSIP